MERIANKSAEIDKIVSVPFLILVAIELATFLVAAINTSSVFVSVWAVVVRDIAILSIELRD